MRPKDCPDDYEPNWTSIAEVLRFHGKDPDTCLPKPEFRLNVVPVTPNELHAYASAIKAQAPKQWWKHVDENYESWASCAQEDWDRDAAEYSAWLLKSKAEDYKERLKREAEERWLKQEHDRATRKSRDLIVVAIIIAIIMFFHALKG